MSFDTDTTPVVRYSAPAIILHWLIAVLMIGNVIFAWQIEKLPDDWIRPAFDTHKSIGITVLGLVLLRILWRLGHKPPPFSNGMSAWERVLAHLTHFGLYGLMLFMPITGWLHDSAWKDAATHPMYLFGLIRWPRIGLIAHQPPATKEMLHNLFGEFHAIGGYVLVGLVFLHVAGALKHQFIDHEREFRRMWSR